MLQMQQMSRLVNSISKILDIFNVLNKNLFYFNRFSFPEIYNGYNLINLRGKLLAMVHVVHVAGDKIGNFCSAKELKLSSKISLKVGQSAFSARTWSQL